MGSKPVSKRKYAQRRRAQLFQEQQGICFWAGAPGCTREMILEPSTGLHQPDNLCTLDHLYDRFHPDRRRPIPGEKRLVAACYACNQRRSKERDAEMNHRKRLGLRIGRARGPERSTAYSEPTGATLADIWPRASNG